MSASDRTAAIDESRSLHAARRRGTLALAEREVLRMLRLWTQTIVPTVLAAVLFIVVFGVALGGQIRTVAGVDYEVFIVPGLVLMGVATSAFANTATSIYQARNDGFIEDPVSSPMGPGHLLGGYLAGGVARGLIIGAATLACARLLVDYPLQRPWIMVVALLLTGIAFAALGTAVGLLSRGWEFQTVVGSLVIQPLVFLGGVFYSVSALSEPYRTLTHADPIYYMVEAARTGVVGTGEIELWLSLGVTGLVTGVMVGVAWICFWRGAGIRN